MPCPWLVPPQQAQGLPRVLRHAHSGLLRSALHNPLQTEVLLAAILAAPSYSGTWSAQKG